MGFWIGLIFSGLANHIRAGSERGRVKTHQARVGLMTELGSNA